MRKAVIDIETVALNGAPRSEDGSKQEETEGDRGALDPLTGRIACIGLIVLKDRHEAEFGVSLISKNEKSLLQRFWDYLGERRVSSFVAHNGLGFDLPFLWKRSVVNQVRPSLALDLRRYRNDFVYDTMAMWANWDPRSYPKLDALAAGLGVGRKSGAGSEVAALWASEKYEEISRYCLHDCWLTYACYCSMDFANFVPEEKIPTSIEFL